MASAQVYITVDFKREVIRRIGRYEVVRIRAFIKDKQIAVNYVIRETAKP